MRLIDADALKAWIDCGRLRPPMEICFSELDVVRMLDKQPTIDAEPVRHASWEQYPGPGYTRCTHCKLEFDERKMPSARDYCPNCGEKMDLEVQDDKDEWSVVQDLSYLTCPSCICNPMLKDIPFDRNESCESVVMRGVLTIKSLAAELEQVERERDAAVEELDHFCDNCKYVDNAYGEEPCPSRTEYDHCDRCPGWQWRGVKED